MTCIHSFWVPEFLFKRDVIPYGGNNAEHCPATTRSSSPRRSEGSFVGRCAELCGTYHSEMNFEVRVVSGPRSSTAYLGALAKIHQPSSADYSARPIRSR